MATIKVSFKPLVEALEAMGTSTVAEALSSQSILDIITAKAGGGGGVETSFVEVNNQKVGRQCAITKAYFPHNNTDKDVSFFYVNGSYCIPAEIMKATARKTWEAGQEAKLTKLENKMLDGKISPQDWKAEVTTIKAESFEFVMDEAQKEEINVTFGGYPTKEELATAYAEGSIIPFSAFAEEIKALRAK